MLILKFAVKHQCIRVYLKWFPQIYASCCPISEQCKVPPSPSKKSTICSKHNKGSYRLQMPCPNPNPSSASWWSGGRAAKREGAGWQLDKFTFGWKNDDSKVTFLLAFENTRFSNWLQLEIQANRKLWVELCCALSYYWGKKLLKVLACSVACFSSSSKALFKTHFPDVYNIIVPKVQNLLW